MNMKRLVLGGVKSGKSRFAEQLAGQWAELPGHRPEEVTYLATARTGDAEFDLRITRHRLQRPAGWKTIEEPLHIGAEIEKVSDLDRCVLVECLTLWMSNLLENEALLEARIDAFCATLATSEAEIILVSNETGLGIMPVNPLARRFGDEIGVLHQRLASLCDEVVLMVAGLPCYLKKKPDNPK